VIPCWRQLHDEELYKHYLHSLPNIASMIKSRVMGWVGFVACMGRRSESFSRKTEWKETTWELEA
jgi:hypothetical protein